MPRMRNTVTGAIVHVPDEKAERLGREWAPADEAKPKRAPKKPADPKPADTE